MNHIRAHLLSIHTTGARVWPVKMYYLTANWVFRRQPFETILLCLLYRDAARYA